MFSTAFRCKKQDSGTVVIIYFFKLRDIKECWKSVIEAKLRLSWKHKRMLAMYAASCAPAQLYQRFQMSNTTSLLSTQHLMKDKRV